MPIPTGARQVPGNPNRVILPSGETVTRSRARSLGAQQLGFRSEYAYRKSGHAGGDDKYFRSFLRSPQGQRVSAQARASGKSMSDLRQEVIAARNAGHREKGQPWYEFMETYDMYDESEIFSEISP